MKHPLNFATGEYLDQSGAASWMKTNGPSNRTDPPRNLRAQSGNGKILVTWDAPIVTNGITGWKIYKGSESSLLDSIYDPNVRQYNVPASAGASPPTQNIFVSSFSKRGESIKIQIQGTALVDASAPADPAPPADSAASGSTGVKFGIDGSSDAGFATR